MFGIENEYNESMSGEGQQVIIPWFFCIGKFGSFLFIDRNSNSILILNSEFEFIHKISVSNYPMGITMDEEDRVIVVCLSDNNCLQIFLITSYITDLYPLSFRDLSFP